MRNHDREPDEWCGGPGSFLQNIRGGRTGRREKEDAGSLLQPRVRVDETERRGVWKSTK